jgi:hypothetical protein
MILFYFGFRNLSGKPVSLKSCKRIEQQLNIDAST